VPAPHLPRRVVAALGAAIYLAGSYVAPIVHIVVEHAGVHGEQSATGIDPAKLVDPRTGRVDLGKLATALNGKHDESKPHSHGQGEGPLDHGRGALAHFGVAFVAAAPVPFVPQRPVPLPRLAERLAQRDVATALHFLAVQRAQAPPA
jgi:hypothetical protein